MNPRPAEALAVHNRLGKCTLELPHSRAYWERRGTVNTPIDPKLAFEQGWFGAKGLPRVQMLLANFRVRFDAFPSTLPLLSGWQQMTAETRRSLCHWHLQLADPLYRRFTGTYLVERRETQRMDVTRDLVTRWVERQIEGRWGLATCAKFSSNLLATAYAAGLLSTNRDPRPMRHPLVDDVALTYLLFLLREVQFQGTILENPYLASVGLCGELLERRLKRLTAIRFRRQGDLVDFDWQFTNLAEWGRMTVCATEAIGLRGAS
jgi:hypothetical protein